MEAPTPKNVTELQSFLGAINYNGHFIPGMSTITAPLYNLLQKGVDWKWTGEQENASVVLKNKLTESPVLCLYDKNLPLKLSCDASLYGIGAVLIKSCVSG